MSHLRLLARLYYRPLAAISEIIDTGSWTFGVLLVIGISAVMEHAQPAPSPYFSYGIFKSLLGLAVCVVPAGIALAVAFESVGSFAVIFRRDFASLLACATMCWSAAHLLMVPLSLARIAPTLVLFCIGEALFACWLVCIFRTLYGTSWPIAGVMSLGSIAALPVGITLYSTFGHVLSYLASPFILYYLYMATQGEIGDITSSFRRRQNFKRMMDAAALNPHDPDPPYQLGLIYQQRRQYS